MIAHMMGCERFSEITDEKLDKKKPVEAQHFDAMDVYNKVRRTRKRKRRQKHGCEEGRRAASKSIWW